MVIRHHRFSPNNSLYLGTKLGVYYKDDTHTSWSVFSQALPNTVVTDLEINSNASLLVAATHGRGVWETPIPTYLPAKDAALTALTFGQNDIISCNTAQQPLKLKIYNRGNDDINHLDINYSIDGTAATTTWNGTLTSGDFIDITLVNQSFNIGTHQIEASINLAGDQVSSNNQKNLSFTINTNENLSYSNNFENVTNDVLLTQTDNQQNSIWQIGTPNGSSLNQAGSGTNAYCTNLNGNYGDNQKEYLYSPCFDFTNFINPTISFNMAYNIEENWDAFYVEYTTNHGIDWQLLGTANDANWYNNDITQGACMGNQWSGTHSAVTNYSHDLAMLTNESNVIFRFVMASDTNLNYEGVMIDDITITGNLSIDQNNLQNSVLVYPNPAKENTHIKWNESLNINRIKIYNTQGALIFSTNIAQDRNQLQIDTKYFSKGMYFINLSTDKNKIIKKLIIQ